MNSTFMYLTTTTNMVEAYHNRLKTVFLLRRRCYDPLRLLEISAGHPTKAWVHARSILAHELASYNLLTNRVVAGRGKRAERRTAIVTDAMQLLERTDAVQWEWPQSLDQVLAPAMADDAGLDGVDLEELCDALFQVVTMSMTMDLCREPTPRAARAGDDAKPLLRWMKNGRRCEMQLSARHCSCGRRDCAELLAAETVCRQALRLPGSLADWPPLLTLARASPQEGSADGRAGDEAAPDAARVQAAHTARAGKAAGIAATHGSAALTVPNASASAVYPPAPATMEPLPSALGPGEPQCLLARTGLHARGAAAAQGLAPPRHTSGRKRLFHAGKNVKITGAHLRMLRGSDN